MEMKYYNPSNNFKAPIPREPRPYRPPRQKAEVILPIRPEVLPEPEPELELEPEPLPVTELSECAPEAEKQKLFPAEQDDLLLLGLIFILLSNHCEDYLLLIVLGYLLLADKRKQI